MRGADFNSNHELLLSNIQIKFKIIGREKHQTARCNLEKLKHNDVRETSKFEQKTDSKHSYKKRMTRKYYGRKEEILLRKKQEWY